MKHLFRCWRTVEGAVRRSRSVLLMLDYDGTLAPIVSTPGEAVLPDRTRAVLGRLAAMRRFRIAIMSGRKLSDVQRRVGLSNVCYAGNHGLEITGPRINFTHDEAVKALDAIHALRVQLTKRLARTPGVTVEDKTFTLSVHYRLAPAGTSRHIEKVVEEAAASFNELRTRRGMKVLEVTPAVQWDKGAAAAWLRGRLGHDAAQFYVGDDATDEDAFRRLRHAFTILVAEKPRKTHARYRLNNPEQVADFLSRLMRISGRAE